MLAVERQYDDYVYWRSQAPTSAREQEIEYWRRRLDPLPDDLILPFEEPSPSFDGPRGRLLRRALPEHTREGARRLAAAAGPAAAGSIGRQDRIFTILQLFFYRCADYRNKTHLLLPRWG